MNRILLTLAAASLALGSCGATPKENEPIPPAAAEAPATKTLPAPQTEGGMPLNEAIAARRSVRAYAARKLTDAEAGQLLWAGQGITSADGKRAAPSAMHTYPLTLYYLDAEATWRYEPKPHALAKAAAGDHRPALAAAAPQEQVKQAPALIVIVADLGATTAKFGAPQAERFAALEAGHAAQNIALEATALGLGTVTMAGFDAAAVKTALALTGSQEPLYLLPVGAKP